MSEGTKTIGFMPRRRDIGRAEFRAHYEEVHAPLGASLFPFRRYCRNHLRDPAAEPGFDCVSEFWIPSVRRIADLLAGEMGETMRADERTFLDQPANRAAVAEEALRPAAEGAPIVLLLHRDGGERAALIEACRAVGAGLDLLSPFDERPLPCDAIVHLTGEAPALPDGWRIAHRLEVERCETDPATLQGF